MDQATQTADLHAVLLMLGWVSAFGCQHAKSIQSWFLGCIGTVRAERCGHNVDDKIYVTQIKLTLSGVSRH